MGGRFLHIVLMPEDGGAVRNFRFTAGVLRATILGLIGLVVALGASLTLHVRTFREAHELVSLKAENVALREQIADFREAAAELESNVAWVGQREREARLLAGLDPVDDETRRLGIGGPMLQIEPSGSIKGDLRGDLRDQESRLEKLRRDLAFQKQSLSEVLTTLQSNKEKLARTPTICPVRSGYSLSSGFGARTDPFTGRWGQHNGTDFRAAPGTPVLSTADGVVRFVGLNGDFGLCVQIDHGDGLETSYCHLASTSVRPGQRLKRGERIGSVGNSGRSTGSHLHYEVLLHGRPVDPGRYILSLSAIVD